MRPSIQLIGPRPAKIGELAVKAEAAGFEAAGLPSPYGFYTGMGVLAEATNEILLPSSISPLFVIILAYNPSGSSDWELTHDIKNSTVRAKVTINLFFILINLFYN